MRKGRCTKYSLFTAGIKFDLIDTKHRSEIKKKEKNSISLVQAFPPLDEKIGLRLSVMMTKGEPVYKNA